MRKDTSVLLAIALCTATVCATDAKAADTRGRLTFGNGAAAGGLATTIAADGPISTATLPTVVTFSAAVNNQGKSLSADGNSGLELGGRS
jgi:hypothetical protein